MRRPLLLSFMVLGLAISAVGAVGVFAPFTDRATTGTNDVSSGERPRAADLQIAWPVPDFANCSGVTFVDDSTSPGVTAVNVQPGYQNHTSFCLRNNGSLPLTVSASVIDVVEIDFACTGDESAAGDATCGGDAQGELGNVIANYLSIGPCLTGPPLDFVGFVGASPTYAVPGTLAPGAIWCGLLETFYPLNRPDTDVLQAQSDRLTWRLAFDATT